MIITSLRFPLFFFSFLFLRFFITFVGGGGSVQSLLILLLKRRHCCSGAFKDCFLFVCVCWKSALCHFGEENMNFWPQRIMHGVYLVQQEGKFDAWKWWLNLLKKKKEKPMVGCSGHMARPVLDRKKIKNWSWFEARPEVGLFRLNVNFCRIKSTFSFLKCVVQPQETLQKPLLSSLHIHMYVCVAKRY